METLEFNNKVTTLSSRCREKDKKTGITRKLLMTTGLMVCGAFYLMNTANAQAGKSLDCRACEQTLSMSSRLALTVSQAKNAYNINMYVDNKFDKIKYKSSFPVDEKVGTFRQLGKERDKLMEKILTYSQYVLYLHSEKRKGFAMN